MELTLASFFIKKSRNFYVFIRNAQAKFLKECTFKSHHIFFFFSSRTWKQNRGRVFDNKLGVKSKYSKCKFHSIAT